MMHIPTPVLEPVMQSQPLPAAFPHAMVLTVPALFDRCLGQYRDAVFQSHNFDVAFTRWLTQRKDFAYSHPEDIFALETALFALARSVHRLWFKTDLPASVAPEQELFTWFEPNYLEDSTIIALSDAVEEIVDLELLGSAYESLLPAEDRKRWGIFFTLPNLSEALLDSAGYTVEADIETSPLVDLSCGSGTLLLHGAKRLWRRCERLGLTPAQTAETIMTNLVGFDINPFLVFLTRLNLLWRVQAWTGTVVARPPFRIETVDALNPIGMLDTPPLLWRQFTKREGIFAGGARWIVGNPPFGKVRLGASQEACFRPTIYGHANRYGLFLQLGIDTLGDGGRLSYLIPSSFLSGLYFKSLRRYLVERTRLCQVVEIPSRRDVFDDVLQGMLLLTVEKPPSSGVVRIGRIDNNGAANASTVTVPSKRAFFRRNGEVYFLISPHAVDYDIAGKFFAVKNTLASHAVGYQAKTGTIVWNRLRDHLSASEPDTVPLVWANNVGRYRFLWSAERNRERAALRVTKRTKPLLLSQHAILVQRTTAKEQPRRLIAAFPSDFFAAHTTYAAENHLNCVVKVRRDSTIQERYLLALVNSSLYDYVFRLINGNTQVSATELNLLPVPIVEPAVQAEFAKLTMRCEQGDTEVDEEIDQRVFDLFGLDDRQRQVITAFYTERKANGRRNAD